MFSNLLSSINENIDELLDTLVFINSDITKSLTHIVGHKGINIICNALIYGIILYYSVQYLLSHITFSHVEKPLQFIFKLLLCAIAFNLSEYLCSALISLCSTVSTIICEMGNYFYDYDISFSGLIKNVFSSDYFTTNSFNLFSFDGLLKSSMSFGLFNLTISYAIRYIMIKVLLVLAPFAILSLSNAKTSVFFKSWFRIFLSLLLLQVFIAIILLVCFVVNDKDGRLISPSLMHIAMLYTLFKANGFMKDLIGGFATDVSTEMSTLSSLYKGGFSR